MGKLFGNGLGHRDSISGRVIPKTQKRVHNTFLLNTQYYKVHIKDKWGNPGKGVVPPLHLGVVAIENGAFGSFSTMVANFTYITFNCVFKLRTYTKLNCLK